MLIIAAQIGIPYLKTKGQDLFETLGGSHQTDLFADEPDEDRLASVRARNLSLPIRLTLAFRCCPPKDERRNS